jgi:hypothetical protein
MERVYSAQVLVLVENMKNILEMHGIESRITNHYLSAAVGEIPPHEAWPQLWVSEQDLEQAKQVVEEALSDSPESQTVRICPSCGEEVEGQFAECWNCGTVLD